MVIGIDANELTKVYQTGFFVFLETMLDWFQFLAPENQYVLFAKKDFTMKSTWNSCKKIIYKRKLTGTFSVCWFLDTLIKNNKVDIFWGPTHVIPLSKDVCKKVVTVHDISTILNPEWGTTYHSLLQRFLIPKVLNSANRVMAISQNTKNDLLKKYNIDSKKIDVIYNGDSPYNYKMRTFTFEEEYKIREKYGIKNRYFLFCGTIEPRKNLITILKAFDLFRKQNDECSSQLVLCGSIGWKYRNIMTAINNSPYKEDIILTGFVSEPEKEFLYRNCISVLYPSFYEGLGLPIIEGMSCGVPVITAMNSSLPEVGGNNAFYIEPATNVKQLKNYMEKVFYMTSTERKELSLKSVAHAKTFSRKECAKKLLDIFMEI